MLLIPTCLWEFPDNFQYITFDFSFLRTLKYVVTLTSFSELAPWIIIGIRKCKVKALESILNLVINTFAAAALEKNCQCYTTPILIPLTCYALRLPFSVSGPALQGLLGHGNSLLPQFRYRLCFNCGHKKKTMSWQLIFNENDFINYSEVSRAYQNWEKCKL